MTCLCQGNSSARRWAGVFLEHSDEVSEACGRMTIQWWGLIPFVLMLGSIAVFPLMSSLSHWWEQPRHQLLIALALGLPVMVWFLASGAGEHVAHALVEYAQFICLLFALFVVSGGIHLRGDIRATPANNTIFLAIGGLLASFVGTTGAAMLLIRPLLATNRERVHRVHTVVFCIFVVANCGGMLTPLGDPPLFLGMLRGVPFTWTFNLFPYWLVVNLLLLTSFYALDKRRYAEEPVSARLSDDVSTIPLGLSGKVNLLWFVMIISAVALIPSVDLHAIQEGHAGFAQVMPWREIVMITAALGSVITSSDEVRYKDNQFSWAPILEVGALFIGIFLTMMPALEFLGEKAPGLPLNNVTFFVFTGGLSAFLDNAPTYATFFEMAAQFDAPTMIAGVPEAFLISISLGAVFCGAITYIGNGPNFMVKAVAEADGVNMPSFGKYIVLSVLYLVPALTALVLIFIADAWWTLPAGVLVVLTLVGRDIFFIWQARRKMAAAHLHPVHVGDFHVVGEQVQEPVTKSIISSIAAKRPGSKSR